MEPIRLEGWKQAWVLPAGSTGTVNLSYTPDGAYHLSLVVGAGLAALLAVLALWPRRLMPGGKRLRAGEIVGTRALADIGSGWLSRWLVLPLGLVFGVWVAGVVGAALVALILLFMWWLGRGAPKKLRHAKPGSPAMGGRMLQRLAGPWTVTVSLVLAGGAMALGTYLASYMPFHDITAMFGSALRGWVPQLLCLPGLARLVLSLGQRGDGLDADADPPTTASEQEPKDGAETTDSGDGETIDGRSDDDGGSGTSTPVTEEART